MVDSPELVSARLRGINVNQNTRLYEHVRYKDGICALRRRRGRSGEWSRGEQLHQGIEGSMQGREGSQDRWFLDVSLIYRST